MKASDSSTATNLIWRIMLQGIHSPSRTHGRRCQHREALADTLLDPDELPSQEEWYTRLEQVAQYRTHGASTMICCGNDCTTHCSQQCRSSCKQHMPNSQFRASSRTRHDRLVGTLLHSSPKPRYEWGAYAARRTRSKGQSGVSLSSDTSAVARAQTGVIRNMIERLILSRAGTVKAGAPRNA